MQIWIGRFKPKKGIKNPCSVFAKPSPSPLSLSLTPCSLVSVGMATEDSGFTWETPSDEEPEFESGDEGSDQNPAEKTQSPWDFGAFAEAVAEDHARRNTSSVDEKISRLRQQRALSLPHLNDDSDSDSDSEPHRQVSLSLSLSMLVFAPMLALLTDFICGFDWLGGLQARGRGRRTRR